MCDLLQGIPAQTGVRNRKDEFWSIMSRLKTFATGFKERRDKKAEENKAKKKAECAQLSDKGDNQDKGQDPEGDHEGDHKHSQ